jgi:hypothetical protein
VCNIKCVSFEFTKENSLTAYVVGWCGKLRAVSRIFVSCFYHFPCYRLTSLAHLYQVYFTGSHVLGVDN